MSRRRGGFAVVLVVALLAAIVLLLLALAGLTRSEIRATTQQVAAARARREALVGLRVALGRLQAAAGPDARSTATAETLGARNAHWCGVWTDAGAPVWLVSGAPSGASAAVTTGGTGADGAVLVGANTTPAAEDAVAARFENLAVPEWAGQAGEQVVGRFAYWIGDEGVKGNVGVIDRVDAVPIPLWPAAEDPVSSAGERARLRQLVAHCVGADALNYGGVPATSGFQLLAENDAASARRWVQLGAAVTRAELRFQDLGAAQATENYRAFVRRNFHALTVCSVGVLANAARGGLRRNLSDLAAADTPAAVRDLERFRPVAGRLPINPGTAGAGEPTAQIKPLVTEWALDFVPYREEGGERLLVGCRLRLELWNPFSLPLAQTPAGVADLRVRIGGLPRAEVRGPAGAVGVVDLGAVLGAAREIAVDVPGDISAGGPVVVETVVAPAWDSGLVVEDPNPGDAGDDVLGWETVPDAGRALSLELIESAGGAVLTTLGGFPSADFARRSEGGWAVAGNAPFGASSGAVVARLGASYHWRLDPARRSWAEWVAPEGARAAGPDLKAARLEFDPAVWKPVAGDPVVNAGAVAGQFAATELFAAGRVLTAYDFTVQRNLSVAALGQLSVEGGRAFGVGNPWGAERNAVFDEAFFNPVPASWRPGDALANVRHRVVEPTGDAVPTAAELGGVAAARFLAVDGMFNVNSVSPEAWTALLGRAVLGWAVADGSTQDLENPFFVFGQSACCAPAAARGVRQFSDEAIQTLATEIAGRIARRPRPFRSLAEFVSSGLLQEAIDAAGLNTRAAFCADLGGVAPERWSANYLTQAALLNTLAPVLAVRSDTFVIRVAAEALNPALAADDPDRIAARAWCEAVVQRLPEYIDASEDAAEWPETHTENAALGRRFRIVQFRWLGPDDI